uniref:KH domain-containing, RNA-binding, signal transduction-associated protein 2 n=1 Tax=Myxine glutinosa TaxID=7769 RepID=UPI00358F9BA0
MGTPKILMLPICSENCEPLQDEFQTIAILYQQVARYVLGTEIQWVKEGEAKKEVETYRDIVSNRNIKLTEKVLIPIKQHPKFNFVGKLLGPQGNSLKRLQAETGTKMSILGKGCMRDKTKEEELRRGGEGKYIHLREELHVLIEVFAPPGEAYARMGHAFKEVKKFLVPDYNDEIRQEQLRELTFLNGSAENTHGLGRGRARGRPIPSLPPPHAATAVGRTNEEA